MHETRYTPEAAEHDERGKVGILVLDEAHLLTHDALEALRLLTTS
jgi:type II secretory pathway predicted ATPase ExeA